MLGLPVEFHVFNKEAPVFGLCTNWSKTKLMHVEDELDQPPSTIPLAATLMSLPCLSYTWAQKFPTLVTSS